MSSERQTLFFQLLLNKYHLTDRDSAVRCLSDELRHELDGTKTAWNDPTILLKSDVNLIRHVHYSWILPILQSDPENLRSLFAESLPAPANTRLLGMLKLPQTPISTEWGR